MHCIRWAANDASLGSPEILDSASMRAGIILANWFKHEARRVYAMLDQTDAERDRSRLIDWIKRRGGSVTVRDVQMGCRWLQEPGAAEAALNALVDKGHGTWHDVPTTAKGGRPGTTFLLSAPSTSAKPSGL